MFGNLFGNMEEMQAKVREKLADIRLEVSGSDDLVKVEVNARRELLNLSIDPQLMADGDPEQLEDLLLITINRALEQAAAAEAEETQRLLKEMLPPGLDGLSDMFG